MSRFWRFHFPALLWAIVLTGLLLVPGPEVPVSEWQWLIVPDYSDKLVHALFFGVAAWLFQRSLAAGAPISVPASRHLVAAVVLASAFGGVLELAQSSPRLHRDCDPWDATANAVGACLYAGGCAARERLTSPDPAAGG
jgi:hypothetical protein